MTLASSEPEFARRLKFIGVALAAWGGVAALFSLQRLYGGAARGVAPIWDHLALEMSIVWGSWAILTPLILFVVRRLPLPSEHPRRMLLHVPTGIVIGLLHSSLVAAITPLFIWRPSWAPIRDMFAGRLASAIANETLIYFLVVAVMYAFVYASQSRQREVGIIEAEAGLARAQVDVQELESERRQLANLLEGVTSRGPETDSLAVPARDGVVKVPVGSIEWLQAEDNYVRLHAAGRSHLVRTTLGALEKKLAPSDFVRIHRSAVVSVSRIARLRRLASDRYAVVLTNGAQLRVSRAYRKQVAAVVGTPITPE
jgi:DNA-binding LytR/AlgR family response regulator